MGGLRDQQGPRNWLCQAAGAAAPSGGRALHAVSNRGGACRRYIIRGFSKHSFAQAHTKPTPSQKQPARVLTETFLVHAWANRNQPGEPSAFVSTGKYPSRHPGARRRHGLYRQFHWSRGLHGR
ncbi:MAG: hypothetical protein B7X65_01565 [Polaromonas sp. 39-63-25]|nr:MAG: hypothetical protein B7Y60_02145 [Polaromonas sp. 35-63-35]OYZ21955.1 MAG: hypothetical protein B7Y28_03575 [Polaromonas sp. 16-63-31]OYZ80392.1 MAG: hypothetical protein B7Y09_04205 [Polaromonas sp. 24-63-21]OZA51456.1 MAG: hypothetical protein B7X88_07630 [Polaromonas sp. 17-63-33]OZA90073.1 MAG: hypothetical protein B7X65_01565 [Polaromonas sp. 39-63-25]